MTPLFVFSLPRSGSTLLQRMLAGHSRIATASEPWLLLPLAGMSPTVELRTYSEYSASGARTAIADVIERMPGGLDDYHGILRDAALRFYGAAAGRDVEYFVDKTPRYFLIIDFILEVFPDAKAIVLVRHPLDVLASVVTTWGGGRLWIHNALIDLYRGPRHIHEAMARHAHRLHVLSYEELVADPGAACDAVCAYLGLAREEGMLSGAGREQIAGSMGDKSDGIASAQVLPASVGRWRDVLQNPVRRAFARRYLRTLGPEVCAAFRVDLEATLRELARPQGSWKGTAADVVALAASYAAPMVAATVVREQWRRRRREPIVKLD